MVLVSRTVCGARTSLHRSLIPSAGATERHSNKAEEKLAQSRLQLDSSATP